MKSSFLSLPENLIVFRFLINKVKDKEKLVSTKTIASLAERSGKTEAEVEELWNDVKEKASKKFEKEDKHFWAYVSRSVQFKLGLANKKTSFKEFADKSKNDKK